MLALCSWLKLSTHSLEIPDWETYTTWIFLMKGKYTSSNSMKHTTLRYYPVLIWVNILGIWHIYICCTLLNTNWSTKWSLSSTPTYTWFPTKLLRTADPGKLMCPSPVWRCSLHPFNLHNLIGCIDYCSMAKVVCEEHIRSTNLEVLSTYQIRLYSYTHGISAG